MTYGTVVKRAYGAKIFLCSFGFSSCTLQGRNIGTPNWITTILQKYQIKRKMSAFAWCRSLFTTEPAPER